MSKKTYRTYFLKSLVLHFKGEDGTPIDVTFRGGIQVDSTARYSTSNKKIQKLLEKSSCFGRDFYIEREEDLTPSAEETGLLATASEPAPEKAPLTDVKDVRRFHNLVEMKAVMTELGLEVSPEMNYIATKAVAAKAGYDFQIQKNF